MASGDTEIQEQMQQQMKQGLKTYLDLLIELQDFLKIKVIYSKLLMI